MTGFTPSPIPAAAEPRYPDLAGRVAVVTGGSRGIGAETARALARNGAVVAVIGRDERALADVAGAITAAGGRALAVPADCTVDAEVAHAVATITEELGAADILAPFAGGNGMPVPTPRETAAHWREVVESDLTSTFLCVSGFLPGMIECGRGAIVTMASAAARQAAHSSAAYAAAKAGVIALTRRGGPPRDPGQLHRAVGDRERADAHVDNRGAARRAGRVVPVAAHRPARRRGGGHAVSRLGRLVVDHRRHARHRRRQDHAVKAG